MRIKLRTAIQLISSISISKFHNDNDAIAIQDSVLFKLLLLPINNAVQI